LCCFPVCQSVVLLIAQNIHFYWRILPFDEQLQKKRCISNTCDNSVLKLQGFIVQWKGDFSLTKFTFSLF
jgi:hypothetical protein